MAKKKAVSLVNIGGQIVDASIEIPEEDFRDWYIYDGEKVTLPPEKRIMVLAGFAKAECGKRISAVADQFCQLNLTASASAGLLTKEQMATYKKGLAWVTQMRANVATLVAGDDGMKHYRIRVIENDQSWPKVPEGVQELADLF